MGMVRGTIIAEKGAEAAMSDTRASPTESCTIPVTGMTCAACSGRVQRTLERTPGVATANVNLMTGAATVAYDPGRHLARRGWWRPSASTGYGAELPLPEEPAEDLLDAQDERATAAEEVRDLRRKFAVSAAVGHARAWCSAMSSGSASARPATALRYILLALTLPVVGWAGPPLLYPRLGRLPPSQRRHEHADRGRHRRRVPLQRWS